MSESMIYCFKECSTKIAGIISNSAGFFIDSPEGVFLPAEQVGENSIYINKEKSLRFTQKVKITNNTAVITCSLENIGSVVSAEIKKIEPLNIVFNTPHNRWKHIYANGGTSENFYPPEAFRTFEYNRVSAVYPAYDKLLIESEGKGRSSNLHLPFLISLIDYEDTTEGFICGMEWSGTWYMSSENIGTDLSRIIAGIKINNLVLEPGEVLRLPEVHLVFFSGGSDDATNHLRKYLLNHVCAKYNGRNVIPPVTYDHWAHIWQNYDCEFLKRQALIAAETGVEIFVLDAAWFAGSFPEGVGNWEIVDKDKFPNGIEELQRHVESLGMGFGLWFEMERVADGTKLHNDHPNWHSQNHLNLALKEVQEYIIETISGYIEKLNLVWIRWDYNIDPIDFWTTVDPTLKIQFAYMEGLYYVLDSLMARYPQLMIEGCASGGRRIDIGTMRRAHTFWISDHSCNPMVCRYMQARANRFLPGHLLNSSIANAIGKGSEDLNAASVISRMLGKLAFDGDIACWTPEFTGIATFWAEEFKRIRHLLSQDFFQLLPMPATMEDWDAVQFVDYSRSSSVLFVFCGDRSGLMNIKLRGLNSRLVYTMENAAEGESFSMTGDEMMNNGVRIALMAHEAGLWNINTLDR